MANIDIFRHRGETWNVKRREKKEREARELRDGVVEGYRDLIAGRVVEFKGNLRQTIKEAKRREAEGWE